MKYWLTGALLCCIHVLRAQGYDTLTVYFRLNDPSLTKQTVTTLDSFAERSSGKKLLIYGYADYLGSATANSTLATARAENVRKYLTSHGTNPDQILICAGIGEIDRNKENGDGFPPDRRVSIFIKRKKGTSKIKVQQIDNELFKTDTSSFNSKKSEVIVSNDRSALKQLSSLRPNQTIALKNIHFQMGRHIIREESKETLDELYEALADNPNLVIRIEGHICCMNGPQDGMDVDTYEPTLSVNRAKFIYDYLVFKGIDPERLQYVGFGHSRPLIPKEHSEEDARANRRVEIRVISNQVR